MARPDLGEVEWDWVTTAYGKLFHVARDSAHTFCGRRAFENSDAPVAWFNGRACSICVWARRR